MAPRHSSRTVAKVLAILLVLIFSKYFYMASIGSYFTFYLIHHFGIPVAQAQLHLFAFLVASAAGGFLGGPLGDRIGRKPIIWTSILGVAPFALMLPHADLLWTTVLAVLIGFVLSSAFSAIVVYAQEMMPHRIGMVSGLFFGFAFGMGGLGACWACWQTGPALNSSSADRVPATARHRRGVAAAIAACCSLRGWVCRACSPAPAEATSTAEAGYSAGGSGCGTP